MMNIPRLFFFLLPSFGLCHIAHSADRREPFLQNAREHLEQVRENEPALDLDLTGLMLRAAADGNQALAQTLIRIGIHPNAANADGTTPLFEAIRQNRLPFVAMLQAVGVDMTGILRNGLSPIRYAAMLGHLEIAQFLLPYLHPPGVFLLDAEGNSLLHVAATQADPRMLLLFFLNGLPLDSRNRIGRTPLHVAVLHQNSDVIVLLRALGADVDARDQGGHTPLTLARRLHNPTLRNVLTQPVAAELIMQFYHQFIVDHAPRLAISELDNPASCAEQVIKRLKSDDPDDDETREEKRTRISAQPHPIASWGAPVSH